MSKCLPSASLTASSAVGNKQGVYHGYLVTVTTATAAINIRNGTVTGQIIDVIPSGTTAGTVRYFADGVACDQGIFVDFTTGSGTVVVLFE